MKYTWVPRTEVYNADQAVNDAMDAQYRAMNNGYDSDNLTSSSEENY